MIKSLKLSISKLRSDDNLFKKVFNETVECCTETGVIIPQVKKKEKSLQKLINYRKINILHVRKKKR